MLRRLLANTPACLIGLMGNTANYLKALAAKTLALAGLASGRPKAELMVENHIYAAVMARLRYRRAPGKLPAAGDVKAMGAYWKAHYNTVLGKGLASEFEAKLTKALPEL